MEVFYEWVKKGLVCKEKEEWKLRRKFLSQVFNHDFIVSHIPLKVKIANKLFEEFDQKQEKDEKVDLK